MPADLSSEKKLNRRYSRSKPSAQRAGLTASNGKPARNRQELLEARRVKEERTKRKCNWVFLKLHGG